MGATTPRPGFGLPNRKLYYLHGRGIRGVTRSRVEKLLYMFISHVFSQHDILS